ncbi:MAG: VWA domain-containing protein [Cyanobacteria bacterium REEB67]|nr:VWA domain-containing protein [Cyanobacteria bacterium REEB67]
MNEHKIRNQKGAAVTGLVLALFFFIMLVGFFSFDSSRIQMAQRELTATCDSAALAGTAMLTSYPTDNDDTSHTKLQYAQSMAAQYARNMFQAGNLLGQGLANANVVTSYAAAHTTGSPGSTNVMISLADPQNNYTGVAPGSATCVNGRAIMCDACYTYTPVFLSIVGVQQVGLNARSGGGLPQVDAVLVFDFSGSMDDATKVSFIRRTWDSNLTPKAGSATAGQFDQQMVIDVNHPYPGVPTQVPGRGAIHYIEITPPTTSHRLSDCVQHNYANNANGLNLNVLPPVNLDLSANNDSQIPSANKFYFDPFLRVNMHPFRAIVPKSGTLPTQANGGNWQSDYGTPPGNCTLIPPYGYGYFWTPTLNSATMTLSPPNAATMAYRPEARSPQAGGSWSAQMGDQIYMKNVYGGSSGYMPLDLTNVAVYRDYTDLVVNIAPPGSWPYAQPVSTPDLFVNFSFQFPAQEPDTDLAGKTFNFEDLGVVVEAARGNLDNATNANGALLDRGSYITTNGATTTASSAASLTHVAPHYQKAYQRLAMLASQPIATAIDGADGGFFQKINSLCDCRFGFVGFSNSDLLTAGGSPNSQTVGTAHSNSASSSYANSFYISANFVEAPGVKFWVTSPNGGNVSGASTGAENNDNIAGGVGTGFRQPRRPLTKSETQYNSVDGVNGCRLNGSFSGGVTSNVSAAWSDTGDYANGLENGRPIDHTATYEALNTARHMFLDSAHYNIANISTSRPAAKHAIVFFTDGVPDSADASPSLTVAQSCKSDGIAIYSIGMDVTNNSVLQANQVSFLGNLNTGLAGASGNGGRFFQCTDSTTVKQAFNAVARRLAQSQR